MCLLSSGQKLLLNATATIITTANIIQHVSVVKTTNLYNELKVEKRKRENENDKSDYLEKNRLCCYWLHCKNVLVDS